MQDLYLGVQQYISNNEWKGDIEPTAAKVQQSSWIQLDSIVIAALVFGIGLVVVVVVNLL